MPCEGWRCEIAAETQWRWWAILLHVFHGLVPTSCQPFQNMKPQKSCRTLNWQSLNAGSFTELNVGPSPQKKAMAIPTSRYEATQSTKDHVATWGICSANSTSFKGKVEALRFFLKALFPTHGIHVIDTQLTACVQ